MERLSKDEYYLNIAYAVAERSTCLKKHFGAVIVKDNAVISTGYNGVPIGELHCTVCTKCDHGKDESTYLSCKSVHAEQNAMLRASWEAMHGATLYLAGYRLNCESGHEEKFKEAAPCEICLRLIKNSGIAKVVTEQGTIYINRAWYSIH